METKTKLTNECICFHGDHFVIHLFWIFAIFICSLSSKALAQQPTQPSLNLSAPQLDSLAFPADKAGIAAYVKVSEQIDVNRLSPIFREVRDVGDNYIIGIVPIDDIGGTIDVYLYADRDGWFVAYLPKTEPTATIMQWLSISDMNQYNKPVITNLNRTILTDALDQAKNLLLLVLPDVKYYHFKYPDATKTTLFIKTTQESDVMQFKIPQNFTLFESSFYHFSLNGGDSKVKLDGFLVSDLRETATSTGKNYNYSSFRDIHFYQASYMSLNTLHTIEVINNDTLPSGLASVLLYKEGE